MWSSYKKAYGDVKELANKYPEWRDNMTQVRKPDTASTFWVAKEIAENKCNRYEII
jgi:hypothetical protein